MIKTMAIALLCAVMVLALNLACSPTCSEKADGASPTTASEAASDDTTDNDLADDESGACGIACPDGVGQCLSGQICDNHECRWP